MTQTQQNDEMIERGVQMLKHVMDFSAAVKPPIAAFSIKNFEAIMLKHPDTELMIIFSNKEENTVFEVVGINRSFAGTHALAINLNRLDNPVRVKPNTIIIPLNKLLENNTIDEFDTWYTNINPHDTSGESVVLLVKDNDGYWIARDKNENPTKDLPDNFTFCLPSNSSDISIGAEALITENVIPEDEKKFTVKFTPLEHVPEGAHAVDMSEQVEAQDAQSDSPLAHVIELDMNDPVSRAHILENAPAENSANLEELVRLADQQPMELPANIDEVDAWAKRHYPVRINVAHCDEHASHTTAHLSDKEIMMRIPLGDTHTNPEIISRVFQNIRDTIRVKACAWLTEIAGLSNDVLTTLMSKIEQSGDEVINDQAILDVAKNHFGLLPGATYSDLFATVIEEMMKDYIDTSASEEHEIQPIFGDHSAHEADVVSEPSESGLNIAQCGCHEHHKHVVIPQERESLDAENDELEEFNDNEGEEGKAIEILVQHPFAESASLFDEAVFSNHAISGTDDERNPNVSVRIGIIDSLVSEIYDLSQFPGNIRRQIVYDVMHEKTAGVDYIIGILKTYKEYIDLKAHNDYLNSDHESHFVNEMALSIIRAFRNYMGDTTTSPRVLDGILNLVYHLDIYRRSGFPSITGVVNLDNPGDRLVWEYLRRMFDPSTRAFARTSTDAGQLVIGLMDKAGNFNGCFENTGAKPVEDWLIENANNKANAFINRISAWAFSRY